MPSEDERRGIDTCREQILSQGSRDPSLFSRSVTSLQREASHFRKRSTRRPPPPILITTTQKSTFELFFFTKLVSSPYRSASVSLIDVIVSMQSHLKWFREAIYGGYRHRQQHGVSQTSLVALYVTTKHTGDVVVHCALQRKSRETNRNRDVSKQSLFRG